MAFQIALLGPFSICNDRISFEHLLRNRERALLAYLANDVEFHHDRGVLAELFWGDREGEESVRGETAARNNLNQLLHTLRQQLHSYRDSDTTALLEGDRQAIWLDITGGHQIDAVHFTHLLHSWTIPALEAAVALYRDEFLARLTLSDSPPAFEHWLITQREHYQHAVLEALQTLTYTALIHAAYSTARRYVQQQLTIFPAYEAAYRQLMIAFALDQQRNEALRLYKQCCDAVFQEQGVEPEPLTKWLAEQIRAGLVNHETIAQISNNVRRANDERPPVAGSKPLHLEGVLDINPRGAALIADYELWFTGQVDGCTRIFRWRADAAPTLQPFALALTGPEATYNQFAPAISSDGTKIAFALGVPDAANPCNRDLYLADIDGQNVECLVHTPLDAYHPAWSPDGRFLAYHLGRPAVDSCPPVNYGIWVLDIQTRDTWQLTDAEDYDPVWSPDGCYIAYHSAYPHPHAERLSWVIKALAFEISQRTVNSCDQWIAIQDGTRSTSPAWVNPNSMIFAARTAKEDPDGMFQWDIYRLPVRRDRQYVRPEPLTHNDFDNLYPALFDRHFLLWHAFPHEREGEEGSTYEKDAHIYVLDIKVEPLEEIPLVTGVGNPRDGVLVRRDGEGNAHSV